MAANEGIGTDSRTYRGLITIGNAVARATQSLIPQEEREKLLHRVIFNSRFSN